MKINHASGLNGINPYQKQLKSTEAAKNSGVKPGDKVEISNAAKEMQNAAQLMADRREKVASLKQQIAEGTYKTDAAASAKAMLDFYGKQP